MPTIKDQAILNAVNQKPGMTHPEVVTAVGGEWRCVGNALHRLADKGAVEALPCRPGSPAALRYYPGGTA